MSIRDGFREAVEQIARAFHRSQHRHFKFENCPKSHCVGARAALAADAPEQASQTVSTAGAEYLHKHPPAPAPAEETSAPCTGDQDCRHVCPVPAEEAGTPTREVPPHVCDDRYGYRIDGVSTCGECGKPLAKPFDARAEDAYKRFLANPQAGVTYHQFFIAGYAAGAATGAQREPDGYAYRYADGIRFETDGRSINGGYPLETIPYWLKAAPAVKELSEEQVREVLEEAAQIAENMNTVSAMQDGGLRDPRTVALDIAKGIRALRQPAPSESAQKGTQPERSVERYLEDLERGGNPG